MTNTGYDNPQNMLAKRASGDSHKPFHFHNSPHIEMDSTPGAAGAHYSTIEDLLVWDFARTSNKLLKKNH